MSSIICEKKINELLLNAEETPSEYRLKIIQKGRDCQGLSLQEAATLLQIEDKNELDKLFKAANEVKERIYGNRIVFFAPLYTSNECSNNCLYCGFRVNNKGLRRKTLSTEEMIQEAKEIVNMGHKRLLLVCGEDKTKTPIGHTIQAVKAIYGQTGIRRINVNTAPMDVQEFKLLKEANIGTYQIFQETYHRETYKKMHPTGSKSKYEYRLSAIDRAISAGIDDFGIGVLLGLYDFKFDVLASLMHAKYLDDKYKVGPHTISIPRLKRALGSKIDQAPYPVSDDQLKKIVAIYRLTLPYTGIILSTRESEELRDQLLNLGVSQMSAGSKTNPGGYEHVLDNGSQFEISDERTLDEMVSTICEKGYLPSFCTACYRKNRTGERFMELAKNKDIQMFCHPNSILTFQENIEDYASAEVKEKYEKIIQKELEKIDNPTIKELTKSRLNQIQQGERDLYF